MEGLVPVMEVGNEIGDNVSRPSQAQSHEVKSMTEGEKSPAQGFRWIQPGELSELLKRSQNGDSLAMEALYEHFKKPLFNLAYRYTYNIMVAEDLLQDIFIKIFTHLQDVQNPALFPAWAFRIAVNTCLSFLREKKYELQRKVSLDEIGEIVDDGVHDSRDQDLKKSLDEAVETLPGKLKSVFLLHDVQGFKHEEIARMLHCSVGTSKSQLFKARMKIRHHLRGRQVFKENGDEV